VLQGFVSLPTSWIFLAVSPRRQLALPMCGGFRAAIDCATAKIAGISTVTV